MILPTGVVLANRYRLGTALGRGGAACTYRAEDLLERTEVALKLLEPARPIEELRREFERVRGLVHPHLARVREFAVVKAAGGARRAFYTAELVRGGDLRAYVQRRGFAGALRAFGDVLEALHLLHRLGLRHGDVKPENVLIDERGRAVLIDLGCAAPLGRASPALSGTPGYFAPELSAGLAADERADLYAFGVMLRELGAGPEHARLVARLTAERAGERPSSAREVLTLLGDERDVESHALGRAARCLGRERELAAALGALAHLARQGPGARCVWIEGPAGVGRSRLLRELCFELASAEIDVLEASARAPSPVREALARRYGPCAPGFEALLEQLSDAARARDTCVLVLDDAQRLGPEARLELGFALRALEPRGRFAALIASSEPIADVPLERALALKLSPLDDAALGEWSRGVLEPARVPALRRFTGGYPRYVERTLTALVAGRMREAELAECGAASELDDESARSLALALSGLSPAEQRALAEIALAGSAGELAPAARPGGDPALERAHRRLFERDLVNSCGGRFVLAREADRGPLLAQLAPELVRESYLEAARRLAAEPAPEAVAAAIEYFARAGRAGEARSLFERERERSTHTPRPFAQRLEPLAACFSPDQQVALAQLIRLAGESARALSLLARARRRARPNALCREAAEAYLALGRPLRAARMLERCQDPLDAGYAELSARALVRRGAYLEAREVAQRGLACAREPQERARLLEALALSLSYLGELAGAQAQIEAALALHAPDDVRARARGAALRGFVLLRAGAFAEAAQAYGEALSLAEAAGLADLVVNALLNLGGARQALGHWGAALDAYERALRLARALGRRASVRSLRANLANLALEIGAFERARAELAALAEEAGESAALERSFAIYRAELALWTGAPARALSELAPALAADAPQRERVEARVLELSALLSLGEHTRAEHALGLFAAEAGELPLDLTARRAEVEARLLAQRGRKREAVQRLEAALARVKQGGEQALIARLETALSQLCRALSADALAAEHAACARARWERIALDLPPTLRDAFWAHPNRQGLAGEPPEPAQGRTRASLSLSRVRELNRRISSLHTRDEVLAFALDAAIELTGAERGFVLLQSEGVRGFEVAAAEQIDRARMPKSEWKWSRSIAERVIREGEPVLTVDAGRDPRFARQASVHAMQLQSVLCAPIRGRSRILGALYLDNRLARARFALEDAELLLTFADQVAIALAHAELVQALEDKARELAREKHKVEQLAKGQAREIERLAEELSAERATHAMRYRYEDIVGRSEPMRRVLSILDRVIDTDLSVLVQGESGTGKELVARAVHMLGPRKHKPFVSVSCAALPEALLESELFGHVKGAFTGALSAREGLFVSARGGTLFLDELGEMPLSMQAKLLRALSDGEVRPVGASKSFAVDVRLVCATNRNLRQRVAEGLFREDLYYRVAAVELTLPALRERHEDIIPIADAILKRRADESGEPARSLAPDAIRALLSYPWPGNVRELQNTLLRASVMASSGVIRGQDLGLHARGRAASDNAPSTRGEYVRKEAERLLSALEAERWNVSKVAKNLGIPRNTLYRKLARYGIHRS